MSSLASDLATARRERIPTIALRPDSRYPAEMDDIVVKGVDVHFEAMDEHSWWLGCSFPNGDRITFNLWRAQKPARTCVTVQEMPDEWIDWDSGEHRKRR